jgi:hypothetical protein
MLTSTERKASSSRCRYVFISCLRLSSICPHLLDHCHPLRHISEKRSLLQDQKGIIEGLLQLYPDVAGALYIVIDVLFNVFSESTVVTTKRTVCAPRYLCPLCRQSQVTIQKDMTCAIEKMIWITLQQPAMRSHLTVLSYHHWRLPPRRQCFTCSISITFVCRLDFLFTDIARTSTDSTRKFSWKR